jgi:GntR family transcriptional regulator
MFERIDPRSPTPLYAQIAALVRVAIASRELAPGVVLPSVRQLAAQLRINPATVVQAYRELEIEGLVATRQGLGTSVLDVPAARLDTDRAAEARRLVRDMLVQAARSGISPDELRGAVDHELNGRKHE